MQTNKTCSLCALEFCGVHLQTPQARYPTLGLVSDQLVPLHGLPSEVVDSEDWLNAIRFLLHSSRQPVEDAAPREAVHSGWNGSTCVLLFEHQFCSQLNG